MDNQRGRFDRLRNSGEPRIVTAFNLFQTPEPIADIMAGLLPKLGKDAVILEPSAGLGRLYSAARRSGQDGKIILVDNSPACMAEIYQLSAGDNVRLIQKDFLEVSDVTPDAVLMNPPFKMGLDVKHILHAFDLLNNGGVLIALCYNGVKQNSILKPMSTSWEVLPENSFKSEGTNASVVLLTIRKD